MYRLATEKQIQAGVPCVTLTGKEGLWYQQPDLWSKYLRRPDSLESLCYSQFVKMYSSYSSSNKSDGDNIDDDQGEDEEEEEELTETIEQEMEDILEDHDYYEFNYIMTYKDNGRKGQKLPRLIELKDPIPGESSKLKKRQRAAALRFYKGYKN